MNRTVHSSPSSTQTFDRLLNQAFGNVFTPTQGRTFREVWDESPDAIVLRVELPGFRKEQVKIEILDRKLAVTANAPADQAFGGCYQRTWALGRELDPTRISARLDLGILELTLPKVAPAVPESRTIEVQ